jgi:hypothetical protein
MTALVGFAIEVQIDASCKVLTTSKARVRETERHFCKEFEGERLTYQGANSSLPLYCQPENSVREQNNDTENGFV